MYKTFFMGNSKKIVLLLGLLPFGLFAKATNGKSDIPLVHGYVTDAVTKKPVSGVVVSAILPGTTSLKEVTTDADGYFHFGQLPTSQVNLQFDKKGYQSYKRWYVTVKEKLSVKINVEFRPDEPDTVSDDSEYPLLRMLQID